MNIALTFSHVQLLPQQALLVVLITVGKIFLMTLNVLLIPTFTILTQYHGLNMCFEVTNNYGKLIPIINFFDYQL
jgi:hypothetical protein